MSETRDWAALLRMRLGSAADADVVRELADHAADRYREARAEGMSAPEAEAVVDEEIEAWVRDPASLRRPGSRPPLLETCTGASPLGGVGRDLHHAARTLLRRPGHTLLVSLTMALGIGATTALFGVVHGVLLAPLPWPDADRLVRLSENREGAVRTWPWLFTSGSYLAWAEEPATVEGLAAWQNDGATLTGAGEAERLQLTRVSASLFRLLGARPLLGELFVDPATSGESGVLLLSEGLWRERFDASPDAIGRIVELDGVPHRIAGVLPRRFGFPDREARAWAPIDMPVADSDRIALFSAMAKLRPGVTPEQAAAEAGARARAAPRPGMTERAIFGAEGRAVVEVTPLVESLTREVRPALLLLLAAVGLLLATATANVAGLQLTAATGRRRELAVRSAVGAGRARLARLLLAENVLLGMLGGAGGLLLALAAQRVLPALLPPDFPRVDAIAVDLRVAGFAVLLSVGAGLTFGLLPAAFAGRLRLTDVLAEDGGGSLGEGRSAGARVRAAILTVQVALACVLLLGALQLGRSFFVQLAADRGYTTERLLVARLSLPEALYTPERRTQLVTGLLERLRAVPGVQHAATANIHPLSASESLAVFTLHGAAPEGVEPNRVHTAVRTVTPGYFEALGRRLVSGRFLDARDDAGSEPVLVVNRSFAERYLDGEAVGTVLPFHVEEREAWRVVGVVEDARPAQLGADPRPRLFFAQAQRRGGLTMAEVSLLVRSRQEAEVLAPVLRALVQEQDPALVPDWIRPMDDLLADGLSRPRLYSVLLSAFALCALAVAGVGMFGALSYAVATRRREIGLRMALGARPADVVGLVGRRALTLAVLGLVLGLGLSAAAGRFLAGLLWGVEPHDGPGVAAVTAVLATVAVLATALPALRAARVDPQRALRDG